MSDLSRTQWPSVGDYVDALESGGALLGGLASAQTEPGMYGMPAVATGRHAVVAPVMLDGRRTALRFLLSDCPSGRERYRALTVVALEMPGRLILPTTWLDDAIEVGGRTYPGITMEWIDAPALSDWIDDRVADGSTGDLRRLVPHWLEALEALSGAGVVHGDLQHGNVLVGSDGLSLIDYDGCWMEGLPADVGELGHPNYQHPGRAAISGASPNGDSFPALVIHASLLVLADRPELWERFNNGENLIFRAEDFLEPGTSEVWVESASAAGDDTAGALALLQAACRADPRDLPDFPTLLRDGLPADVRPFVPAPAPVAPAPPVVTSIPAATFVTDRATTAAPQPTVVRTAEVHSASPQPPLAQAAYLAPPLTPAPAHTAAAYHPPPPPPAPARRSGSSTTQSILIGVAVGLALIVVLGLGAFVVSNAGSDDEGADGTGDTTNTEPGDTTTTTTTTTTTAAPPVTPTPTAAPPPATCPATAAFTGRWEPATDCLDYPYGTLAEVGEVSAEWVVVVGSHFMSDAGTNQSALEKLANARSRFGPDVVLVDSRRYPGLRDSAWAVVVPWLTSRQEAESFITSSPDCSPTTCFVRNTQYKLPELPG